ncbi:hypothetical protein [Limnohabitans sp. JirII-31]|nr:hypothetical protein [Limnohabitans sp. JirII-31]
MIEITGKKIKKAVLKKYEGDLEIALLKKQFFGVQCPEFLEKTNPK